MPNQDNPEPADERKPVTVKDMSIVAWTVGLNAKDRHGRHSMADWLAKAIRHYAQYENRPMVNFPDEQVSPISSPVSPEANHLPAPIVVSFAEIRDALQAAHAVAESRGVKVSKTVADNANAVLVNQLRAARGLPPLKPRQRSAPKQAKIPFIEEGKLQDQPGETRAEIG